MVAAVGEAPRSPPFLLLTVLTMVDVTTAFGHGSVAESEHPYDLQQRAAELREDLESLAWDARRVASEVGGGIELVEALAQRLDAVEGGLDELTHRVDATESRLARDEDATWRQVDDAFNTSAAVASTYWDTQRAIEAQAKELKNLGERFYDMAPWLGWSERLEAIEYAMPDVDRYLRDLENESEAHRYVEARLDAMEARFDDMEEWVELLEYEPVPDTGQPLRDLEARFDVMESRLGGASERVDATESWCESIQRKSETQAAVIWDLKARFDVMAQEAGGAGGNLRSWMHDLASRVSDQDARMERLEVSSGWLRDLDTEASVLRDMEARLARVEAEALRTSDAKQRVRDAHKFNRAELDRIETRIETWVEAELDQFEERGASFDLVEARPDPQTPDDLDTEASVLRDMEARLKRVEFTHGNVASRVHDLESETTRQNAEMSRVEGLFGWLRDFGRTARERHESTQRPAQDVLVVSTALGAKIRSLEQRTERTEEATRLCGDLESRVSALGRHVSDQQLEVQRLEASGAELGLSLETVVALDGRLVKTEEAYERLLDTTTGSSNKLAGRVDALESALVRVHAFDPLQAYPNPQILDDDYDGMDYDYDYYTKHKLRTYDYDYDSKTALEAYSYDYHALSHDMDAEPPPGASVLWPSTTPPPSPSTPERDAQR